MRTRQGCVDVKHHGRDDFGVHRRRACIGDVVAHVDIAPKTREGVRERGGRDAPFELVLENSLFCSNEAKTRHDRDFVVSAFPTLTKQSPARTSGAAGRQHEHDTVGVVRTRGHRWGRKG